MFYTMGISSSALTTQRLRLDVISSNMANVDTTREKLVDGQWQPYRRKMVVMQPNENSFSSALNNAMGSYTGNKNPAGVKVARIVEDQTPFKSIYDPEHPDADENGYVYQSNVDPLREMVDMISATRSYEANVTVFNATKAMLMKSLDIGK
ncbi:flagellar basal body rod protein FlgC [Siminovitchia fortis]|uniref:Flagellar basal-body rod protein FlgC n=1 Tax=Siminovitchia fortis TaxID=254758 RepID=A0A443J1A4_9BACI|nr:flagellar basal body rod protein FlgC [Siminovitchia fortis]RWR14196.1 flagellar basal body rod protein FlgC [Siminovitchia fortis]WHY83695.1 flagellar basal body rod protein FlgC [Siminovitchia fortis]